jgi:hypothetical protein
MTTGVQWPANSARQRQNSCHHATIAAWTAGQPKYMIGERKVIIVCYCDRKLFSLTISLHLELLEDPLILHGQDRQTEGAGFGWPLLESG